MRKIAYLVSIAAMLLTAQVAHAGGLFPKVVVTVPVLKPYMDALLAGLGESQSLLRPGQEPHDFALTVTQAEMLDRADVIVVPDRKMSPLLKKLLNANKHARIIELSAMPEAEILPYAHENPWLSQMKASLKPEPKEKPKKPQPPQPRPIKISEDDMPVNDPHLWLDPERMAALAAPIADAVAERAPESKVMLKANARALATHLRRDVLPAMQQMLSKTPEAMTALTRPQIPFITYHAAYQYFLQRFHLQHYGEVTQRPEETLGAKTMEAMMSPAQVHITCVIGEEPTVLMKRIAQNGHARIVVLSPEQIPLRKDVDAIDWIQNDYDRLLYVTAKTFSSCL